MLVQDHEPLEHRCRAAWSLCRRRGRGRRDRRRLGAPPRAPRHPAAETPAKEAKAVQDAAKPPGDAEDRRGDAALQGDGHGQGHRQADRRGHGGRPPLDPPVRRRTGCSRRPGTPPAPTARTPSRSPRIRYADALPLHRAGRGAPRLRHPGRVRLRPEHDPQEREAQRAALLRDRSRCARPQPITGRVETPEGEPAAGV